MSDDQNKTNAVNAETPVSPEFPNPSPSDAPEGHQAGPSGKVVNLEALQQARKINDAQRKANDELQATVKGFQDAKPIQVEDKSLDRVLEQCANNLVQKLEDIRNELQNLRESNSRFPI